MKIVKWVEPLTDDCDPVFCFSSVASVIKFQKEKARKLNREYESDEQALDDFIVVYWATIIDVGEDNQLFT